MSKKKLPLSLLMIRGAVGKSFVIRHYKWGTFMSKYPDMTRIVASKEQRKCRNLFKEAVAWAKTVIADEERRREWQRRLKKNKRVYHAAIKEYMLTEKKKMLLAEEAKPAVVQPNIAAVQKPALVPFMNKGIEVVKFIAEKAIEMPIENQMLLLEAG